LREKNAHEEGYFPWSSAVKGEMVAWGSAEVYSLREKMAMIQDIHALQLQVQRMKDTINHHIHDGGMIRCPPSTATARPPSTESILEGLEGQKPLNETLMTWLKASTSWHEQDFGWQVHRVVSQLRTSTGPHNQTITLSDAKMAPDDCRALACLLTFYRIQYSKVYAREAPWDLNLRWK